MPVVSLSDWKKFSESYDELHLLQTAEWGIFKSKFGWEPVYLVHDHEDVQIGALILIRKLPLHISVAYIPKGPVLKKGGEPVSVDYSADYFASFINEIDEVCKQRNAIYLKLEADLIYSTEEEEISGDSEQPPPGFDTSDEVIQPRRTLIIDLSNEIENILGQMKQKTRYNIRLASKRGVVVRTSADIDLFYGLMEETSSRDKFHIHSLDYYKNAFETFNSSGKAELFIAEFEGMPIGGLMVFKSGYRSWYFYGASKGQYREMMPTYVLQLKAIEWAKANGCTEYDLWGVPDYPKQFLESEFTHRSDDLWGVYRFKRGFGGKLYRASSSWDRIYHPILFRIYKLAQKIRTSV